MQHVTFAQIQKGGTFTPDAAWSWRCVGQTKAARAVGFVAILRESSTQVTIKTGYEK